MICPIHMEIRSFMRYPSHVATNWLSNVTKQRGKPVGSATTDEAPSAYSHHSEPDKDLIHARHA